MTLSRSAVLSKQSAIKDAAVSLGLTLVAAGTSLGFFMTFNSWSIPTELTPLFILFGIALVIYLSATVFFDVKHLIQLNRIDQEQELEEDIDHLHKLGMFQLWVNIVVILCIATIVAIATTANLYN